MAHSCTHQEGQEPNEHPGLFPLGLTHEAELLTSEIPLQFTVQPLSVCPAVHDANYACYVACYVVCVQGRNAKGPLSCSLAVQVKSPQRLIKNSLCSDEKTESRRAEAGTGVLGKKTLTLIPSHFEADVQTAIRKSVSLKKGKVV